MKFNDLYNDILKEADIEKLAKRDSREAYEDELDKKEAYKANLLRQDEDPIGDEMDVFEYLGQFRQDNPELFNKFTELLKSDRFVHQVRAMRGVSL